MQACVRMSLAVTTGRISLILTSVVFSLVLSSIESPSHEVHNVSGAQVLTVCAGDQIVLTCQHNVVSNQASRWAFTPPLFDCTRRVIDHSNHDDVEQCGPFTFHNVTGVDESPLELSSTAVARVDEFMNGILIQCWDSERTDANLIGNITLCVIGQPQKLAYGNFSVLNMTEIHWDPLVYHQNCPAWNTMTTYNVTVTSLSLGGQSETSITFTSSGNSADISDVLPSQEYTVSVAMHQIVTLTGGNQHSRTCYIEYPEIMLTISNKKLQDPNGSMATTVSEAVIITFILTSLSFIIVGFIVGTLLSMFVKRRCDLGRSTRNERTANAETVYEEVSEKSTSKQKMEMAANIAYGPVTVMP